jgi:hypothetical protein
LRHECEAEEKHAMRARTMRTTRKLDEEIFVEGGLMEEVVGEEVG